MTKFVGAGEPEPRQEGVAVQQRYGELRAPHIHAVGTPRAKGPHENRYPGLSQYGLDVGDRSGQHSEGASQPRGLFLDLVVVEVDHSPKEMRNS